MRLALALVFVAASATAAPAQSADESRLPETLDRAFRDMVDDLKPALDDAFDAMRPALEDALRNMQPALEGAMDYMRGFEASVDDPRNYELPEVLPNGDIIIRRRDDAPPFRPDARERGPAAPPQSEDGVRT